MMTGSQQGFMESSITSVGTSAMLLALTQTIHDEDVMKKIKEGMSVEIKGRISANNYRSNDDKFYFKTDLIAERVSALE